MNLYVIQRADGMFVAKDGSEHSYTDRLQDAQVYQTREDAERNRCPGNERAVSIADAIGSSPFNLGGAGR